MISKANTNPSKHQTLIEMFFHNQIYFNNHYHNLTKLQINNTLLKVNVTITHSLIIHDKKELSNAHSRLNINNTSF